MRIDRRIDHLPDRHDGFVEPRHPTYDIAQPGPQPVPDWVVTDRNALEADVHLVSRAVPDGAECPLAAKRHHTAEHRMFRDAGYQEGRSTRRTRDVRAMKGRTGYGRQLLAGQWTSAEFDALTRLWQLGGPPVPYPVQCLETELVTEFMGSVDGDRPVLVDVPQIVDLAAIPQGPAYLERDCRIVCRWFAARGLHSAEFDLLLGDLMAQAVAQW